MNTRRDVYLKNLGVGEIWHLRQVATADVFAESQPVSSASVYQNLAPVDITVSSDVSHATWGKLHFDVQQCQACPLCAQYGKGVLETAPDTPSIFVVSDWSMSVQAAQEDPILQKKALLMQNILAALSALLSGDASSQKKPASLSIYHTSLLKAQIVQASQVNFDVAAERGALQCVDFLRRQIELVRPQVLLVFGERVGQVLLGAKSTGLTEMRRTPSTYEGIPVIVTHDIQFLLNSPEFKYQVWQDICSVKRFIA